MKTLASALVALSLIAGIAGPAAAEFGPKDIITGAQGGGR